MADKITIHLNGEDRTVHAGSLSELVVELGLEKRMIAIECNLEVVPKSEYDATLLKEGDRIELVHMIGGG
ncbi:sulfur carrier protein [Mariprofundus ferrinatatus]|uniref:Sulfur carrier protein n=1 Tax=Mariprofundus ferrinatatus TaxID=1921087 RepID=A0A2K8L7N3_9PROT|nr:sulfur carrier protein ThiS [Mariprofundus ferrinatatus]ATX81871.1 sulfur carrier protein [Mariprofundus ferrinatatus]